ncbi:MAG: hypothetical protein DMF63_01810 [Acidobacteria bacterium]|nr:MAG: hypothetical protein DMF63_01810 [Acidobacteriota bacterium]
MMNRSRQFLSAVFILALLSTSVLGFRPIFHPPTISILDALRNDPDNFSVLIGLIRESGLDELTKGGEAYTLLAPTNEAFAKLPAASVASFSKDKKKLRGLLFNHLFPGKVLFKDMFEPEAPANEGNLSTKSARTSGGRLAFFQCNEHHAMPGSKQHLPVIDGKAKVIASDFEGSTAAIQVIDTVLSPEYFEPGKGSSTGDSDNVPPKRASENSRTETALGLNTTTFDTLVGTVTVNLPDDLSAGDMISGTVIAEVKPKSSEAPADQAKALDELNGYVIEVADQSSPMKKPEGNLIDFCKTPGEGNKNMIDFCKSWSIPLTASSIPVVLKDKTGAIIGRTEVPVNPQAFPVKVQDTKYSTPMLGQAGKPFSVQGNMGTLGDTAVKIGGKAAKFLASSPRKMTVVSPRDLKGITDIEVEHNGKSVAKCTYRNISVKLSAGKLNLTKGEVTDLSVTIAGLMSLLTPVSVKLTNGSPSTVSMSGGDSQVLVINPADVNDDYYSTKRTLTGIHAGAFTVSVAPVDPSYANILNNCSPGVQPLPIPTKPAPSPPNTPADNADVPQGNPQPPPHPDRPQSNYRVTLNGFRVNNVTNRGAFQLADEVTFSPDILSIEPSGRVRVRLSGGSTHTIGSTVRARVRGGTSLPNGGLLNGDGFPTQDRPWQRTVPYSTGSPGTIPPTVYFEGTLVDDGSAVAIIPNIWSVDAHSDLDLVGSYIREMRRARPGIARAALNIGRNGGAMELATFLKPGASMGIGNTMSLAIGVPQDRPVGMSPTSDGRFGFIPQVLVLTYGSAAYLSRADFGFGPGIVPVRYVDHPSFGGDYTLFLQVEPMSP